MRKLLSVLAAIGLMCTTASASGLGLFGSYWSPDDGDDSYGGGIKLMGGMDLFYLSVRATYFDDLVDGEGFFDIDLEAIPVDAGIGLRMEPVQEVTLYGGGGATYFFLDTDVGDIDDEVGWYLEAGAELMISDRVSVFGEALWRSVEGTVENDDVDDITTDRVNINLDGFTVNIGLMFH